jgi:hypothetical protein
LPSSTLPEMRREVPENERLDGSSLRHIRVASKEELKDRLMAAVNYFNRDPVVHTWTYKLDKAA